MNDNDRSKWIDNDEGLYRLWKASGWSKKKFLSHNRAVVDYVAAKIKVRREASPLSGLS